MSWPGEKQRHSMSSRGIQTNNVQSQPIKLLIPWEDLSQQKKRAWIKDRMSEFDTDEIASLYLKSLKNNAKELDMWKKLYHDPEYWFWRRERYEAKGVKDVFTNKGLKQYIEEDNHWNTELAVLVKKYNAKAAICGNVVVYENYIPLFRPIDDASFFKEAEPNVVYVWNMNDLPESQFEKEAATVRKQLGKDKKLELIYDPGGA